MANTVSAGAACKLNGALRLHCVQSACCLCMPFDINSTLGSNCFKAFLVLILEILQLTHIKVWMGMQMFVAMHLHLHCTLCVRLTQTLEQAFVQISGPMMNVILEVRIVIAFNAGGFAADFQAYMMLAADLCATSATASSPCPITKDSSSPDSSSGQIYQCPEFPPGTTCSAFTGAKCSC